MSLSKSVFYESVVPLTKRCHKVQLPAALLSAFLCALTVLMLKRSTFSRSVMVSSLGRTELIFY